jgi:hypothetical protein
MAFFFRGRSGVGQDGGDFGPHRRDAKLGFQLRDPHPQLLGLGLGRRGRLGRPAERLRFECRQCGLQSFGSHLIEALFRDV